MHDAYQDTDIVMDLSCIYNTWHRRVLLSWYKESSTNKYLYGAMYFII